MGMFDLIRSGGKRELVPVEVAPFDFTGICQASEELNKLQDEIGGGYFYTVKVPSGESRQFNFFAPGSEESESIDRFSGVIVNAQKFRVRYEGDTLGQPPVCYAPQGTYGKEAGSDEELLCAECPFSRPGTDKAGVGAACKDKVELQILNEGLCSVVVFKLPRQSAEAYRGYAKRLKIECGLEVHQVVTEFALELAYSCKGVKYYRVTFRTVGKLTEENAKISREFAGAFRPYLLLEAEKKEEVQNE